MQKHSANALYIAEHLEKAGMKVFYPGLPSHKQYKLLTKLVNPGFGHSGMLAMDAYDVDTAKKLMALLQDEKVGYLAVSLGYFKTLFSLPSHSTSSEIPDEEQHSMGLSEGLVRMSIGLDNDIDRSFQRIKKCLVQLNLVKE
jgi:methionine-gamma-lyase